MGLPVQVTHAEGVRAWVLTASQGEVCGWRRRVAETLRDWGATEESVALACLGVSELLTNVAKHVEDPRCRLSLRRVRESVVIQVCDRSRELPVVKEPDWASESGRGLWLLGEMAGGVFCERTGRRHRKRVWFHVPLDSSERV